MSKINSNKVHIDGNLVPPIGARKELFVRFSNKVQPMSTSTNNYNINQDDCVNTDPVSMMRTTSKKTCNDNCNANNDRYVDT